MKNETQQKLCPNCNKKLGIWMTGRSMWLDGKRFCSIMCKEEYKKKIAFGDKEYKRKCNKCGKTWYSSMLKEEELKQELKNNRFNEIGAGLGMLSGNWLAAGAGMQTETNKHALQNSFDNLRKCPKCCSIDYKEVIVKCKKK